MLKRVLESIERIAPLSLAETKWDNVGILIEAPYPRAGATKVMLTIDLTMAVLDECVTDPSIGVIVAYHPPLFKPFKRITLADHKQKIALICAANGISVISPHTALDNVCGGINDWLLSGFGAGKATVINPINSNGDGSGRVLTLDTPISTTELIARVKLHLSLPHLRYATGNKPLISTIAICAGSGASVLSGVYADVYLTGEMSHHDVLQAKESGTAVILCEHTNSERGFLAAVLKPKLDVLLDGEFSIQCSLVDADPLVVV